MENGTWKMDNFLSMFFFIPLLLLALLLEGSVTTVPLVLICLLCMLVAKREMSTFVVAFFAGLILDVFTLKTFGGSSLFFIIFLFLILLYQRKYEINSYPFVAAAAFLGSCFFLLIFGYGSWFGQALISSVIAVVLFAGLSFFGSRSMNHESRGFRSITHDS